MELEQQLASVPLLAGLEGRVRKRLADIGKRRTYAADEAIVREGSTGTALYIVLRVAAASSATARPSARSRPVTSSASWP